MVVGFTSSVTLGVFTPGGSVEVSASLDEKNESCTMLSKHTSENLDYHYKNLVLRTFLGPFLSHNLRVRIVRLEESKTPA